MEIKTLLVEDNQGDYIIIQKLIRQIETQNQSDNRYVMKWCPTMTDALESLKSGGFQLIFLDMNLPDSHGVETLETITQISSLASVVVLTGMEDYQTAMEAIKRGAQDYLVKEDLNAQILFRSIHYSLERFNILREKEQLIVDLEDALAKVKTLSGLLPICASCKKIRDDEGYWHQVEEYVQEFSDARFTHGLCPDCAKKMYPDFYK